MAKTSTITVEALEAAQQEAGHAVVAARKALSDLSDQLADAAATDALSAEGAEQERAHQQVDALAKQHARALAALQQAERRQEGINRQLTQARQAAARANLAGLRTAAEREQKALAALAGEAAGHCAELLRLTAEIQRVGRAWIVAQEAVVMAEGIPGQGVPDRFTVEKSLLALTDKALAWLRQIAGGG